MRRKITDLREERARVFEQMKALSEQAEAEGRDLNTEESDKYQRMSGEMDALSGRIERLEREAGLGDALGRRVDVDRDPEREAHEARAEGRITATPEYRDAFVALIRNRGQLGVLDAEHRAALQVGTDSEGGYTVPDEFHRTLVEQAREFGIMRQLATVITTANSGDLEIPKLDTRATAAWTAEEAAFTQSESTFAQKILGSFKVGALSKISDELIHDSAFDLLGFLARDLGEAIALKENNAFVDGTSASTTTPEGIVNKATVGVTGATGQTTDVTTDALIDLFHSVITPYRRNAVWVMDDATIKVVRKKKDTTNQYLWQPGLQAGQPDMLLGRPVYADPDVPTMAASAKSIIFGDVRGYWIRDVEGISVKVLNELYAANGQVGVRVSRRTDGDLIDTDSVKVYQNSAT